ncbi:MAG: superoxide dismutase [Mariniphaga sp.]|nr:superoxide dismutase [Mariniphaga sp.]
MKILALEKQIKTVNWENEQETLIEEAKNVYNLFLKGHLREIYFTESHNAVLILECENKDIAVDLLGELPLVKNKIVEFELIELKPYTGLSRLFKDK